MAETYEHKPGDVVVLKSGGPQMTVSSVSNDERKVVYTQWFVDGLLQTGTFNAASLHNRSETEVPPRTRTP